ncbi:MAG: preprotein translocase subunit SecY [Candidatus Saganbacteria bacterium]|nr:preprotein translocase subunit SecY [Candidatus Saganbacteria bacterium]
MLKTLSGLFNIPDLRKRLLFTLSLIILFRLGAHIPAPGIDPVRISQLIKGGAPLLGLADLFTGGAFYKFSIFAMGIIPYINASIIMQLLTVVIPQLEELSKEGDSGRKKIAQYTRYFTVVLAAIQAVMMSFWLRGAVLPGIAFPVFLISVTISLTAGTTLIMWLGELITERGIGNGASLIIFIGIISRLPSYIGSTVTLVKGGASLMGVIVLSIVFLAMIVAIVIVQEGQRRIQVQYAKRIVGRKVYGGQSTYIPIRINQGGVIPIIFATSVLLFPATIAQFIQHPLFQKFAQALTSSSLTYLLFLFGLIFFFTYFYTAITFNPSELAENIKKWGGFIMGIRPGKPTADYLEYIITRITLVGAAFLGLVATVPVVVENLTHITTFSGLTGTGILIVVGVALDLVRQIETHLITRQYEGLLA